MNTSTHILASLALPLCLLAVLTTGCYEDKGHYDYSYQRKLNLVISPDDYRSVSDNEIVFTYDQPTGTDTLHMTYHVQATTANAQPVPDQELACSWASLNNLSDTIFSQSMKLDIVPNHRTDTFFLMRVHDKVTTLDYYKRVRIRTLLPYINNWFVLHTQNGKQLLGNAVRKGTDIIKTRSMMLFEEHQPEIYSAFDNGKIRDLTFLQMGYGYINSSLINLIAGDELYAFFPYNPQADLRGWYSQMMPTNSDSKVVTGFTDGNALGGLITDEGKVLYSPGYRIYYNLKCDKGTENYRADFATFFEKKLYIWDNTQKKIFYYNTQDNSRLRPTTRVRMEMYNVALLTELEPLLFIGERSLQTLTLVTAIGNSWDDKNTYIDFIFKHPNNTYVSYSLYPDSGNGKNLPKMEVHLLPALILDENSRILVSREYPNQYFVTRENRLYIYNLSTDEFDMIYEGPAGSYIQDLQFKSDQAYDSELMKLYEEDYPLENTLGLAFNQPNDTGEIHELLLEKSGDVKTVYKLDGFSTIQKITFALTTQAY